MSKAKKSERKKSSKGKSPKPDAAGDSRRRKPGSKKSSNAAPVPATLRKPVSKAKTPAATSPAGASPAITQEAISLRAYFIAERRKAMGWAGDSASDWLEAERQVKAEAAGKARQIPASTRRLKIL